jgi:hypothetical protein
VQSVDCKKEESLASLSTHFDTCCTYESFSPSSFSWFPSQIERKFSIILGHCLAKSSIRMIDFLLGSFLGWIWKYANLEFFDEFSMILSIANFWAILSSKSYKWRVCLNYLSIKEASEG